MIDPIANALESIDNRDGGVATRQAPSGGAGVPYIPPTDNQSAKMRKQIEQEAAELVAMNNAARVRMGLEPLVDARHKTVAVEKMEEEKEEDQEQEKKQHHSSICVDKNSKIRN